MVERKEKRVLNFTDSAVRNLPTPTTERLEYWDDGPRSFKGLTVRVSTSGTKVFVLRYRSAGAAQRRFKLGTFPIMTVGEARAEAKRQKLIIDNGGEPTIDRATKREELRLSDLLDAYAIWTDKKSENAKLSDANCRKLIERYDPQMLNTPLSKIRRDDVEALHRLIGTTQCEHRRLYSAHGGRIYSANQVVRYLRAAFNLEIKRGFLTGPNPARTDTRGRQSGGIELYEEHPRRRYLSDEEVMRLHDALRAQPERWRCYFSLMLLLGLRRNELARARWSDVDLEVGTLHIPHAKKGSRTQPLPAAAIAILRGMSSQEYSEWLFPAGRKSKTGGAMVQPRHRWLEILKAAGITEHITIHGLRHSAAAAMIREGVDLYAVGGALGHRTPAITAAVYGHLDLQTKRAALEKGAGRMRFNEVASAPQPAALPTAEPPGREATKPHEAAENDALDILRDAQTE